MGPRVDGKGACSEGASEGDVEGVNERTLHFRKVIVGYDPEAQIAGFQRPCGKALEVIRHDRARQGQLIVFVRSPDKHRAGAAQGIEGAVQVNPACLAAGQPDGVHRHERETVRVGRRDAGPFASAGSGHIAERGDAPRCAFETEA